MNQAVREEGDLRYERKFVIPDMSRRQIECAVRLHPAFFRAIYHPRWINNIYFDDPDLASYTDNLDGKDIRRKVRIRWYGPMRGRVKQPVLEIKTKHGLLGGKHSHTLMPIDIQPGIEAQDLRETLLSSDLPDNVLALLKGLAPVLLNRYQRSYFRSVCGGYRITVDSDEQYVDFAARSNLLRLVHRETDHAILELKYAAGHDQGASEIVKHFRFDLGRYSKYVSGVSLLTFA